jgi:transposase-like protein
MHHQPDALLGILEGHLEEEEVFDRSRKRTETRALGLLLYHAGLSCRRTADVLSMVQEPVSHQPISAWYHRAGDLFRTGPVRYHEALAVDETSLHIEAEGGDLTEVFLWAAVDPDTGEVAHVAVTESRGGVEALGFLRGVLARCRNEPRIHVDRGVWYPWALGTVDVDWSVTSGGARNHVEAWFGLLKNRLKAFRVRWPRNASRETVAEWVKGFVAVWNRDPEASC